MAAMGPGSDRPAGLLPARAGGGARASGGDYSGVRLTAAREAGGGRSDPDPDHVGRVDRQHVPSKWPPHSGQAHVVGNCHHRQVATNTTTTSHPHCHPYPLTTETLMMEDPNRNLAFNDLLSPTSPVTIWNRQVNLHHSLTPPASPCHTPQPPSPNSQTLLHCKRDILVGALHWRQLWPPDATCEPNIRPDPSTPVPHPDDNDQQCLIHTNRAPGSPGRRSYRRHIGSPHAAKVPPRTYLESGLNLRQTSGGRSWGSEAMWTSGNTLYPDPLGSVHRGGRASGLDNEGGAQVRAVPFIISPLSPCSDPTIYMRVFEAVAKCSGTHPLRYAIFVLTLPTRGRIQEFLKGGGGFRVPEKEFLNLPSQKNLWRG